MSSELAFWLNFQLQCDNGWCTVCTVFLSYDLCTVCARTTTPKIFQIYEWSETQRASELFVNGSECASVVVTKSECWENVKFGKRELKRGENEETILHINRGLVIIIAYMKVLVSNLKNLKNPPKSETEQCTHASKKSARVFVSRFLSWDITRGGNGGTRVTQWKVGTLSEP